MINMRYAYGAHCLRSRLMRLRWRNNSFVKSLPDACTCSQHGLMMLSDVCLVGCLAILLVWNLVSRLMPCYLGYPMPGLAARFTTVPGAGELAPFSDRTRASLWPARPWPLPMLGESHKWQNATHTRCRGPGLLPSLRPVAAPRLYVCQSWLE